MNRNHTKAGTYFCIIVDFLKSFILILQCNKIQVKLVNLEKYGKLLCNSE